MQFSTTVLTLLSAFVASSAAVDTLSFTTSTCAGCSTEPGCSVEQRTNLPAGSCFSIFSGDKSLIITGKSNPNCKLELYAAASCSGTPEVHQQIGVCDDFSPKNSFRITC